jgi:stage V sporulation protein G
MKITEVRVKLVNGNDAERLRAFCSITIDELFVIRDLKVIDGTSGPFVAMPSRKVMDHCPKCGGKNHLRARFCNDCGGRLAENRVPRGSDGRATLHADIAHPINMAGREYIQNAVIEAYQNEVELSGQPGYEPKSIETEESRGNEYAELIADLKASGLSKGRDRGSPNRALAETPYEEPVVHQAPLHRESREIRTPVTARSASTQDRGWDDSFGAGLV